MCLSYSTGPEAGSGGVQRIILHSVFSEFSFSS
jgi:hypothetical protein